ncbi:MAG: hypothetical protein BMS9Abin37_0344 [Acidobacteriota bacterium]|nr:MAG: hypothetical protein BMS9Abin37_0344 [Acidobacteriota bacterium]
MRIRLLILLFLVGALSPAIAQDHDTTHTLTSGDVESGFLVAPDFKFTDVNGNFANLAGAYGGWVIDKKFLIGGGVYTLTNGSGPDGMTYGGGVFEYFVNQASLVNVSVRGLVGGGNATLGASFPGFDLGGLGGFDMGGFGHRRGNQGRFPGNLGGVDLDDLARRFDLDDFDFDFDFLNGDFARSTSFFIAEPEVNVILNISERFRFSVGGSYRFIGGAGRLNNRLDGFAANVALKMSFF